MGFSLEDCPRKYFSLTKNNIGTPSPSANKQAKITPFGKGKWKSIAPSLDPSSFPKAIRHRLYVTLLRTELYPPGNGFRPFQYR